MPSGIVPRYTILIGEVPGGVPVFAFVSPPPHAATHVDMSFWDLSTRLEPTLGPRRAIYENVDLLRRDAGRASPSARPSLRQRRGHETAAAPPPPTTVTIRAEGEAMYPRRPGRVQRSRIGVDP
ncbi:hypothetical protein CDD83_8422 [Cordyceps sp. RAO-2017]|nr:hypothetical protein CDD83_8422 [Cordyceps sp. RAO-2017]